MPDIIHGYVDLGPLLKNIKQAAALTNEDTARMVEKEATLFVYNSGKIPGIINITPPISSRTKGKAGLEAGKASIDRDLFGIFEPVSIKGQRTITQLFGEEVEPFVVKTKEKWPDVKAIYLTRNGRRKTGKALTRGQKAAYYVDENKFEALRKELHSRVGWSCACWYVAAIAAGLNPRGVPAWIKKHTGAPGAGNAPKITTTATSFAITLSSDLRFNTALGMEEKALRVLGYREASLARQLPYMVRAALKKAQLDVA